MDWEKLALSKVAHCPYGTAKAREEAFWRTHVADPMGERASSIQDLAYFRTWCDGDLWDLEDPKMDGSGVLGVMVPGLTMQLEPK
jgi:hypothetical protein